MSASEKSFLTAFVSFLGVLATISIFVGRMVFDQFGELSHTITRGNEKIELAITEARNSQSKINDTFVIEIRAINERVDLLYKNGRYVAAEPWPKSYKEEKQK